MLRKIKNNLHLIIIFIVSVILISYGIVYHLNMINDKNNSVIVDAKIYQISTNNNIKTLYISYKVYNKTYKGILNTKDKNITMSSKIKIYCNKNNPTKFKNGTIPKYGLYLIIIGILVLIIDIFSYIKNKLK